jgi:hypothetical protein
MKANDVNDANDANEPIETMEERVARRAREALEAEVTRLQESKRRLLQENALLDKLRCTECNDIDKRELITCKRPECAKVVCKECLNDRIGCYNQANVGQEIFSCPSCACSYPRDKLTTFAGSNYLNAIVFFSTQAVVERERKRVNKLDSLSPEERTELCALKLPCCFRTPVLDFSNCCSISCDLCKSSTCAWCFTHFKREGMGEYNAHEHVKQCSYNPNKGSFYVDTYHKQQLTRAFQAHQARQMCKRLNATLIGDDQEFAHAVHD